MDVSYPLETAKSQKKYTFKVVLDNGVAEEKTSISLHRWSTAIIDIYWDNETPIMIGAETI
jgi:hypothetical protein